MATDWWRRRRRKTTTHTTHWPQSEEEAAAALLPLSAASLSFSLSLLLPLTHYCVRRQCAPLSLPIPLRPRCGRGLRGRACLLLLLSLSQQQKQGPPPPPPHIERSSPPPSEGPNEGEGGRDIFPSDVGGEGGGGVKAPLPFLSPAPCTVRSRGCGGGRREASRRCCWRGTL